MNLFRYYRSKLSKADRTVYDILEYGISNMKSEMTVPSLYTQRLSDIHTFIKLDNPLLFNTDAIRISKTAGAESARIMPHYVMKKKEYTNTLSTVKKRLERVMSCMPDGNCFEKEVFIHDYIVENVVYDRLKKQYSHEVTGPLCHGIGVCEGMSKLFKLMCDAAQIDCICTVGFASPAGSKVKEKERHMWNTVNIGGEYSSVDVTYDNSLSRDGFTRHDFLNVSDRAMFESHSNTVYGVPVCAAEGIDYYSMKGLSFNADESIAKAVKSAFKKPYISVFRYHSDEFGSITDKIGEVYENDRRSADFAGYSLCRTVGDTVELRLKPKND